MEEIIVSARKTDEALQSVPIAISAFNANQLESMNLVQTSDLGRVTPSVHIEPPAVGNATAAKVTIRGQAQSDSLITLDPSIGWYLDDVYLARAYGTVASLFDAERIEVLKGPQGTLYGRNTTGGAVKIVTTKAEPSAGVDGFVTGGVGNYGAQKIGGAINIPLIADTLAVRLAILKDQADGWGQVELHGKANPFAVVGNKDIGDRDTEMYRSNFTWIASSQIDVQFGYEHSKLDVSTLTRNIAPGGDGIGVIPSSTDYYKAKLNDVPRSKATADTANLTVDYEITDHLNSKLIYGWRRVDSSYNSDVDGTAFSISSGDPAHQWARQQSYEWQLSGVAANDALDWMTGLYYFEEDGWDRNISYGSLTGGIVNTTYGRAHNTSQSAFFNSTLRLTDSLNFTGGIRYTKDDKPVFKRQPTFNPATGASGCRTDPGTPNFNAADCSSSASGDFEYVSWSTGFDYTIAEGVMAYVKASQASRSGGQNVRGLDAATSESFKPETARDVEIGFKSQLLENRVRLNADYYHTFYSDIQQSQLLATTSGLTTKVVNAASGDIDGIEFELTALVTDSLTVTATGSLLNWKFDDANSILPSAPGEQYSLRLDYAIPLSIGDLNFDANYSYRGEYAGNAADGRSAIRAFPAATVDAVGLVGGRISLDIVAWDVKVALWGNNLTGEEYSVNPLILYFPSFGLALSNPTIGEPRTYGVEVTKTF